MTVRMRMADVGQRNKRNVWPDARGAIGTMSTQDLGNRAVAHGEGSLAQDARHRDRGVQWDRGPLAATKDDQVAKGARRRFRGGRCEDPDFLVGLEAAR